MRSFSSGGFDTCCVGSFGFEGSGLPFCDDLVARDGNGGPDIISSTILRLHHSIIVNIFIEVFYALFSES